ncbi:hypothetical protein TrCOL_g6777, partial [Triparma columacea]
MSVSSVSFALAISSWLLVSQYHFEVVEMNEDQAGSKRRIVRRRSSGSQKKEVNEAGSSTSSRLFGWKERSSYLSSRGVKAQQPILSYFGMFLEALGNLASASNPGGKIPFCVAENKLTQERLSERFIQAAKVAFPQHEAWEYNDMTGLAKMKGAVARLWNRKVCGGSELVRETDVVCGAGAAAVLNNTFTCTCEVGEAVLIPAPYYAAFENDMEVLSGLRPVRVAVADIVRGATIEEWEAAWAGANAAGVQVGAILVTNPNNPVGVCYKRKVIEETLTWARSHSLFIIVDEIYALSAHGVEGEKFTSVVEIERGLVSSDLGVVWAMSKDFGGSGLRAGVLMTGNEKLKQSMSNISVFSGVSHPMQLMIADVLSDENWVDDYLAYSNEQLRRCYEIVTRTLDEIDVPYVKAR